MKKIETERKYIILKPDIAILENQTGFTSSEITQIYLFDKEKTHRIRKRVYSDGREEYTENTKKRISFMSSVENEEIISSEKYDILKAQIESGTAPVFKRRITFEYEEKVFEIDIYPFWNKTCILEVELKREDEALNFPEFIRVISDVTGIKSYSNHSMAYETPKEIEID